MSREDNLMIARLAYKEIKEVIDKWEIDCGVMCHWDECIIVDGDGFNYLELRGVLDER